MTVPSFDGSSSAAPPRSGREPVEVALEGGPADVPRTLHVMRDVVSAGKIKIPRHGGYEHFERVGVSADSAGPPLFRWTTRTKVAE
ncbi:DUF5988 family protein [Nonomuraea sp. NPDC026600]|uniref:DUF5988 family protein n=1 Tax=Nonomuraea sp. NPDC026600 TaxID=3155363 RepID=UPI0033DD4504